MKMLTGERQRNGHTTMQRKNDKELGRTKKTSDVQQYDERYRYRKIDIDNGRTTTTIDEAIDDWRTTTSTYER